MRFAPPDRDDAPCDDHAARPRASAAALPLINERFPDARGELSPDGAIRVDPSVPGSRHCGDR